MTDQEAELAAEEYAPVIPTLLVHPDTAEQSVREALVRQVTQLEVRTAAVSEAMPVIAASPDLALIVVDGDVGESAGSSLVTALRRHERDLRIVWLGPGATSLGNFGAAPPDRILGPNSELAALDEAVYGLLRLDVYSPPILRILCEATVGILSQAFSSPTVGDCERFLKASQLTLATTSAILPFSGTKLSGWCLVSGEEDVLEAIRRRTVPKARPPQIADFEDLAGEIANHIVGELKRWFALQELRLTSGTPILMHGREYKVREKSGVPSAVVKPRLPEGHIFVQLSLDAGCELVLKNPAARIEIAPASFELLT